MSREIVIWPEKVLTTPTKPVTDFGPPLEALLAEMLEAVRAAEGIGIAANQIGVALKVALVGKEDGSFFEIVNPTVLSREEPEDFEEGCLSVPGEWELCPRFKKVKVRYQDRTGAWHEEAAEGRLAHIYQHEIDHLEGTVFVMHLSPLKRELIKKRMLRRKQG